MRHLAEQCHTSICGYCVTGCFNSLLVNLCVYNSVYTKAILKAVEFKVGSALFFRIIIFSLS